MPSCDADTGPRFESSCAIVPDRAPAKVGTQLRPRTDTTSDHATEQGRARCCSWLRSKEANGRADGSGGSLVIKQSGTLILGHTVVPDAS
jgi:hypothetical protein